MKICKNKNKNNIYKKEKESPGLILCGLVENPRREKSRYPEMKPAVYIVTSFLACH